MKPTMHFGFEGHCATIVQCPSFHSLLPLFYQLELFNRIREYKTQEGKNRDGNHRLHKAHGQGEQSAHPIQIEQENRVQDQTADDLRGGNGKQNLIRADHRGTVFLPAKEPDQENRVSNKNDQ